MNPIEIATAGWYNFFYTLATLVAAAVMWLAGRRYRWDSSTWGFAVISWVAGGVVGALIPRLLIGHLAATRTCLGAIAGATIALVVTARSFRLPAAMALDTTAVAIPLGAAVARIGCFIAECCQGTVTDLPIGIALHAGDLPRHPVQLYDSGLEALLALAIARRLRSNSSPGAVFLASIGGVAAIRFATEFVRDNEKFGPLSLAQWVVLPVALFCFAMLLAPRRVGRTRALSANASPAPLALGTLALAVFVIWRGLPALESSVLMIGVGALTLLLAKRARLAAPAGVAMLALQMPIITTDSTFPRVYTSIGGGMTSGAYDYRHRYTNCDGTTKQDWTRHYSFTGAAGELGVLRQGSPTRAIGVRARGFYDTENVGRAVVRSGTPAVPGPYTRHSSGISIVGDADWKYFGFSLGTSVGSFYPVDEDFTSYNSTGPVAPVKSLGAVGLRVGKLAGASIEARFGDEATTWAPGPLATLTLGVGNSAGDRIRFGTSALGIFVSARHVTPTGLEVLPSFSVGGSGGGAVEGAFQGSVMVRKWFRGARRSPGGR